MHIFNTRETFKDDVLDGLVRANSRMLEKIPNASGVRLIGAPQQGIVSVLVGGGLGHYPAFAGLVGSGLATGAVVGEVFTSPSAAQIHRCTMALDGGAGVVYSYGNYSGDVMNFDMGAARARADGIDVGTVVVSDDVASAPPERAADRRGIAGNFCVYKVLGAAASSGASLDEVVELGAQANRRTRSIGVAFDGCTLPGASQPLFTVASGKMDVGLGIHGEPGIRTMERVDARSLAKVLLEPLLAECPADADGRVVVLMNSLGSTTHEELFVLYSEIAELLDGAGLVVHSCDTGQLVTSLDMEGCSLTLFWPTDQLRVLYDMPAVSAAYRTPSR